MNPPEAITLRFQTDCGRALFEIGASAAIAHKQAAERGERALERLAALNTAEAAAEIARYEQARRGKVNPHDS